ncbi:SNF2 family N-terminal domain-containing protein [Xylariomycetidae sp. FL0641]|nr:SNF2 family N-terminal domain-containing protein [Xylariomycetidae sp. FL0641]
MCIDPPSHNSSSQAICYGTLCDARVKLPTASWQGLPILPWTRYHELKVFPEGISFVLKHHKDGEALGVLDLVSTRILRALRGLPHVMTHASVNLYGPEEMLNRIGDAITQENGYLQHPNLLSEDLKYINPHYFYSKGVRIDLRHLVGPPTGTPEASILSRGLEDALKGLSTASQPTTRYSGVVQLACEEGEITTPLKSHQVQGVGSILERECGDFMSSIYESLVHFTDPQMLRGRLHPPPGGIVADVMGLGKTLTMLSAVVCTKATARDFVMLTGSSLPTTKATLIVATSTQVMEVWISEINKHLRRGTLSVYIFHGSNRPKVLEVLLENDVVLTTYHTLVADWKAKRLLQDVVWFRVVLDEAHWIRNATSQQFKACCNLQAERRWCLTGTPIQNSLDDLRSLMAFLHFHPFSQTGFFRKHIVDHIRPDSPEPFRNLKLLLHATCFRRTAELLDLPPHSTKEVAVDLTDAEAQLYRDILARCKSEFDEIANMKSSKKRYCVLFATTMSLRRLCNHGTFQPNTATLQLPLSKKRSKKPSSKTMGLEDEVVCSYCCGDNADISSGPGALEVCPECTRDLGRSPSRSPMPRENDGGAAAGIPNGFHSMTPSARPFAYPGYGFSSKLNAVVDNIQSSSSSSKSLVFTSWRLTLDILQRLLSDRGIRNLRIDGNTSFADRQAILHDFCQDSGPSVLLLSIATGAVGLTLTVADQVHIVEPQWNPSVEEQAIGRAVRMGQQRSVTIYKYITKKTVEQNIAFLQKRKSQLAKISLDGCDGDQAGKLDDLLFVLQNGSPQI